MKLDEAELSSASTGVPLKVNPGRHEVVASLRGEEKRASVDVVEGELKSLSLVFAGAPAAPSAPPPVPRKLEPPPKAESPPKRALEPQTRTSSLVWIGLGTAVVGSAVGATTGLLAFRAKDDIASRCEAGCPPSTDDDIAGGKTLGTVSTIAFVVAGVGVGVMVYGLFTPVQAPPAQGAKLHWKLGPFGAAGTF